MSELIIALAQVNTDVGDFERNSVKILEYADKAAGVGADLVVFPELSLTGYPPEDLLLKPEFAARSMEYCEKLARDIDDIIAVVGFVERDYDTFNSAAVINRGEVACTYRKTFLPNYGVFDEKRYFGAGNSNTVLDVGGVRVGLTICEDIWFAGGPVEEQVARGGAEVVLNLSASPFNRGKYDYREKLIAARSMDGPVVLVYVNTVGAQDELVFGGGSLVYHPMQGFLAKAQRFKEQLLVCQVDLSSLASSRLLEPRFRYSMPSCSHERFDVCYLDRPAAASSFKPPPCEMPRKMTSSEEIFEALIMGLREYVSRNGFEKVVLGLSGGIDSALTAALGVEALGPDNVICVFLPSKYTSAMSDEAARRLAENLGVKLLNVSIEDVYDAYMRTLTPELGEGEEGPAYENLQARARGNILMALSNAFGYLVLATGNKSEFSMGYCTLYGDMAGGFALIKDMLKTQVYELCEYINTRSEREVIPREIIKRPPTAELRPDQLDTDSLPPYDLLDPVLEAYIERGATAQEMVDAQMDPELVKRVIRTVDANEYKRRQAPVGVKITSRAFGRDWRMPITARAGPIVLDGE